MNGIVATNSLLRISLLLLIGLASLYSRAQVAAVDDLDINTYDYIPLYSSVSENDIIPAGNREFRFLNEPIYGTIEWIDNQEGTYTYLADPLNIALYEFEEETLMYEVCTALLCDTALLVLTLRHFNDDPVTNDDTLYIEQGSTRQASVSWNDFEPDLISDPDGPYMYFYTLTNPQEGIVNNMTLDGTFSYTASGNLGWTSFQYRVFDVCGFDADGTVYIFVTGPNENPIATDLFIESIPEDAPFQSSIINAASDPENDPLSFLLLQQPNNGMATIGYNGEISYFPIANFVGTDTILYEVTDLVGQTDTARIILQVINANNDEPIAPNQSYLGTEDTPLVQSIEYTDIIDGDVLTYALETAPQHGQAAISSTGQLTYSPAPNYFGTDSFSYRSCDNGNLCDVGTINITVIGVNDAPSVVTDYNEVLINGILNGSLTANASDIDSPVSDFIFAVTSAPENGTIQIDDNGSYTYIPGEYFFGQDTIIYSVCDGNNACNSAELVVTVTLVNLAPEAENGIAEIQEDTQGILHLDDVTFDFGNSDLIFSLNESTEIGVFENVTNVGFAFIPANNLHGQYTINYRVCDTGNLCDSAQLTINIEPVNDAPIAEAGLISVDEDNSITWAATYSDIDSESLTLSILIAPSNGNLAGQTYTPDVNFVGIDSFSYQICDDAGACTNAQFIIEVSPVNDAPLATSDTFFADEDSWVVANVSANDDDIDSSELFFTALTEDNPYNITLDAAGMLQWSPPANFTGQVQFAYAVCDEMGACDTAYATIEILVINDAPVVDFAPVSFQEDSAIEYAALSYAFDLEGQTMYQSIVTSSGVNALLNPQAGTISLTAQNNYFGDAFVVLTTCDILGDCSTDTIHIEITPVNDAPYGFETSFNTFQNTNLTGSWYNHIFDLDDSELFLDGEAHFGTLDFSPEGEFVFTPLENFLGQDTLFVHACDSSNSCIDLFYPVNVLPPNQPPIIQSAELAICQGVEATFDLSQLVTDEVDTAGNLNYAFSSAIAATFTLNSESQLLTVAPSPLFYGQMTIEMQVCDNASPSLCSSNTLSLQITGISSPVIQEVIINSVSCQGASDGSIQLADVTEEIGVTYVWNTGSTAEQIDNLGPGDYSVLISGLSTCSQPLSAQFTIYEPEELLVVLTEQSISSPAGGSIESNVSGGTAPYAYAWTGPNGFSATGSAIMGLDDAGDYSLIVTDANGCIHSAFSSITSTNEIYEGELNLYPNPVAGSHITLEFNGLFETTGNLFVVDAYGREIMSKPMTSRQETLSVDSWAAGTYSIRIETSRYRIQKRVLVLK
jgi:hypothetical protein